MPKPESDQFKTIYHLSESATPPHTVDHPEYGVIDDRNVGEKRKGSNDVLFGTEEKALGGLGTRKYAHRYKVPVSAISPELYADDDTELGDTPITPKWQKRPQLWQQVPASRLDALRRKTVIKFVNNAENVITGEGKIVRNTPSYILPKPHMKELGITYEGVEESYIEDPGSYEQVSKRVRKSYGPDIK